MDKQEQIHSKGFDLNRSSNRYSYEGPTIDDSELDYSKIKVGTKTLKDAVLDLGILQKSYGRYFNKFEIYKAIKEKNYPLLREISNYYYSTNGIYRNLCNYFAFLYRYDWYIVPKVSDENVKNDKILKEFDKILKYLDNSHLKKLCGDIALEVMKNGAYYAYIIPSEESLILQQLPVNYCRTYYSVAGNLPAIEFNMRFFDDNFKDLSYRMKVLDLFPEEFKKGYILYKQGKLVQDDMSSNIAEMGRTTLGTLRRDGWYLLNPGSTIKFNFNGSDIPNFVNIIPSLIDLDEAQDLDKRKQMQQLLKIVIQKLPLDKNGDLIFDVDEARDIHNNAVEMLEHAIGLDVLTTFADIKVEDVADNNTRTSTDDLTKVERTVYNNGGVSKNIFNTDSNLSLEKSILQDESTVRNLLLQFHIFFDRIIKEKNSNKKKFCFNFYMLGTTQYNYRDLAKMYKEQVQIGYSKMLPQIAMGHSQSSIIHTAYFENEVLDLSSIMIPPLMSSTLNGQDILGRKGSSNNSTSLNDTDSGEIGRPEKPDDEKSLKTIQNKESM